MGYNPVSSRSRSDLLLPLDVPLEQFLHGAIRHVQVNRKELQKAGYRVLQDTFEILIPCGAPDGHRVTFPNKVTSGDVIFVLQELAHPTWTRSQSLEFTLTSSDFTLFGFALVALFLIMMASHVAMGAMGLAAFQAAILASRRQDGGPRLRGHSACRCEVRLWGPGGTRGRSLETLAAEAASKPSWRPSPSGAHSENQHLGLSG
eukprot:symbB.v1.2.014983.t1/scaffold1107.1/size155946/17